jgi:hypothetical protein
MYRSSLVQQQDPFYDVSLPHADLEKCMEILEHWDFGFVHQVLSFSRVDDESVTSCILSFAPYALGGYIIAQRYASVFFEAGEAAFLRRKSKRAYYRVLAKAAIRLRGPAFWRYHREGLQVLRETITCPYLVLQIGLMLLWLALNPGMTGVAAWRSWNKRKQSRRRRAAVRCTPATRSIGLEATAALRQRPRETDAPSYPGCCEAGAPVSDDR